MIVRMPKSSSNIESFGKLLQCSNTLPVETHIEKFFGGLVMGTTAGMFKSETSMFGNTFTVDTRLLNIGDTGHRLMAQAALPIPGRNAMDAEASRMRCRWVEGHAQRQGRVR